MTAGAPVTVLTGHLGAGKTTLLNRLLVEPAMARAAVIVNEFGDIGIDHHLVERVEGDMLMLTTGCFCCVARGDLVGALEGLVEQRSRDAIAFDRILIETTGLADPGPVLNALLPRPGFEACRLDRLITVVDAAGGMGMIRRSGEATRQVVLADLLAVSKVDLLATSQPEALDALMQELRMLNPTAPIRLADDVEGLLACPLSPLPGEEQPEDRMVGRHAHRHLDDIATVVLRAGAIEPRRFEVFLGRVLAGCGADLLRLKGFLATPATPDRPTLINVVQHRIHPAAVLDRWPDADRGTRLVVIAKAWCTQEVAALWADVFGPPQIDRPDAAALMAETGPGLF